MIESLRGILRRLQSAGSLAGQFRRLRETARFTDGARKVMELAIQDARSRKHEYIGTEHVLAGLVNERHGVAAHVLRKLGIDLQKIRPEIERIVPSGSATVSMRTLPWTPRTRKVIEWSREEGRILNHNFIGTEHLLLGLLREPDGVAGVVLNSLGVNLDGARAEILKRYDEDGPTKTIQ